MAIGDTAALAFQIRVDNDTAIRDVVNFRQFIARETAAIGTSFNGAAAGTNRFASAVGLSATQVTSLTRAAPVAGAAIAGIGAATLGAGAALFQFAKNASDAGSEIFDLSAKTGLGAESLSAIKFAAEQSGASLEEFAQAFALFQNKLTDAAAKGQTLFGIDSARALQDQEYALRSLVTLLNGPLPAGFSRASLAAEVMGRSGSNLLATFDTLGPSMDKFIAHAKRMGVVLSEEDVKAADEFGDTLTVLDAQMSAVANRMALQYAPAMSDVMKEIGQFATQAQPVLSVGVKAVTAVIQEQANELRGWAAALRTARNVAAGLPLGTAFQAASLAGATGTPGVVSEAGGGGGVGGNPEAERAAREKVLDDAKKLDAKGVELLREAREKAAEDARRARDQMLAEEKAAAARSVASLQAYYAHRNELREIGERESTEIVKREAKSRQDAHEFEVRSIINIERASYRERVRQAERLIEVAKERGAEAETILALERALKVLHAELTNFNSNIGPRTTDAIRADNLARLDNVAAINKQAEALLRLNSVGPQVAPGNLPGGVPVGPPTTFKGEPVGIVIPPDAEGGANGDPKPPNFGPWHEAITGLKSVAVESWGAMSQAFGQMVGGLVSGEKVSGRALLAMAKQAMLAIAIESAARAIFHTGMGIAYLFLNPPLAANQFAAAKTFAISAAVAGGLTAAIPGGGSASGGAAGYGAAASAGSDFGSNRDRSIREARTGGMSDPNRPQSSLPMGELTIRIDMGDGHVESKVARIFRRGGELRSVLRSDLLGEAHA